MILRLLIPLLCLTACSPGTEKTDPASPADRPTAAVAPLNTDEAIDQIRQQYALIRGGMASFDTTSVVYDDPPYGGRVHAWMNDEEPVLVADEVFNDHGPFVREYYLKDGEVFFVYERSETIEMREDPTHHLREVRTYVHDGRAIRQLLKSRAFPHDADMSMDTVPNNERQLAADDSARIALEIDAEIQRLLALVGGAYSP